ncbi:UNVERIFIED_CONTAM: hypothetical protein K2H54_045035 [Gekko kuhli]
MEGRLTMEIDKTGRSTNLTIREVEMEDDAIYYCAASDTVVGSARGPEPKHARGVLLSSSLSGFQETCMHVTRRGCASSEAELNQILWFVSAVLLESPSATAGKTMSFSYTWAVFILSVLKGSVGQSVNPTEGTVTVTQGQPISLRCGYTSPVQAYPFWYVQHHSQPPKLFLREVGKDGSEEGARQGFGADHNKTSKSYNMKKAASQLSDAAIYFCAVSDTVRPTIRDTEQKHACVTVQQEGSQRIQ